MEDNTERITGDIPAVEGCIPLQPEAVTTISPKTKNQKGKVSNNDHGFCLVYHHNNYYHIQKLVYSIYDISHFIT